MSKNLERSITILFSAVTVVFIMTMALHEGFFDWAFARHHNVLSWYIRPVFLIPFIYFSYKRQPVGISATIFLLLTSMFWFPEPAQVDPVVREFLAMEKAYLTSGLSPAKVFFAFVVVFSMGSLSYAFWHRNKKVGIVILVFIAVGKVSWSIAEGGASGKAIILPAAIGLAVCIAFAFYRFKHT